MLLVIPIQVFLAGRGEGAEGESPESKGQVMLGPAKVSLALTFFQSLIAPRSSFGRRRTAAAGEQSSGRGARSEHGLPLHWQSRGPRPNEQPGPQTPEQHPSPAGLPAGTAPP